jgi:hypothetical protein
MKFPTTRRWFPKFPQKYKGDPTCIISRSSWETRFLNWCDNNPSILEYSSEEVRIPYRCPTDNRRHMYFVDFYIKVKTRDNQTKTYLVEVKPAKQTQPPEYPGRRTKHYITESLSFIKNQAKWKAATEYCKDRGYEFVIITENELGLN